jgi:hypothetical protein
MTAITEELVLVFLYAHTHACAHTHTVFHVVVVSSEQIDM